MAFHREEPGDFRSSKGSSMSTEGSDILDLGLSRWKVQSVAAFVIGAAELRSTILKGSGMLAFEKFFALFPRCCRWKRGYLERCSWKGGQLAAIGLESLAALLAAKQGLKVAATTWGLEAWRNYLAQF